MALFNIAQTHKCGTLVMNFIVYDRKMIKKCFKFYIYKKKFLNLNINILNIL